ncbi:MAG: hypothetical protein HN509_13580 [Halobacteriovoraceae bacterium]|nr:hypothetical protein [Halobacteriovoraceae bacterium]
MISGLLLAAGNVASEEISEQPRCTMGMLGKEIKVFEALMAKRELKRCLGAPEKLINKCARTCFGEVSPVGIDPQSSVEEFWDKFTRKLISQGNHYTISGPLVGKINIVVEEGYLTEKELAQFCQNLTENLKEAMELIGAKKAPPGLTLYLYGKDLSKSPLSFGNAQGLTKGTKGLAVAFAKTQGDPTIHEFTHLLTLNQMDSESLSEGLPEYIQYKIQPELAVGINARDSVKNADQEALGLIKRFEEENRVIPSYVKKDCRPVNILSTIGSNYLARFVLDDDDKVPHENCYLNINRDPIGLRPGNVVVYKKRYRKSFYHASHSFIKYLVEERGGMQKFMKLYGSGGSPEDYQNLYGEDIDSIREKWIVHIKSKAQ